MSSNIKTVSDKVSIDLKSMFELELVHGSDGCKSMIESIMWQYTEYKKTIEYPYKIDIKLGGKKCQWVIESEGAQMIVCDLDGNEVDLEKLKAESSPIGYDLEENT